jgi:hypothetical protein
VKSNEEAKLVTSTKDILVLEGSSKLNPGRAEEI